MAIWIISFVSILGVLFRPWKLPEWLCAVTGSVFLLLFQLIPLSAATQALNEAVDVCLFLIGMMLLSEQARGEGLFDWLAGWAKQHAKGSSRRLFVLIYVAGVLVTAFLSNDATAVVMTPAVYASVKQAGAKPLPYLFACAFIANAASFILPISNPANLVVFGSHPPAITSWLRMFGLPSIASIVATFLVLWFWFREPLRTPLEAADPPKSGAKPGLSACGRLTAAGLLAVVLILMISSFLEWKLGLPTLLASVAIVAVIAFQKREWPKQVLKDIAWGVVPLVAGLFVIVEAMNHAGALKITHSLLLTVNQLPGLLGKLMAAFGVGLASNLLNNLPVGLISGMAVHREGVSEGVRNAVLIGVDLGPNLSVTGSLATLLWLMALRREGINTSGFAFFQLGLLAMPMALILAILAL
jgi:arsenical pump membrane protein